MSEIVALQKKFDLPTSLAKLLLLLAKNENVTNGDIESTGKITKEAKGAVWRLRRSVAVHGITVRSRRDVGYWLEDEDRAKVMDAIK